MPAPRNLAAVALAQRWRATRQSRISSRAQNSRHQVRVSPPSHPPPSDPSQRARAHSSSHANSLTAFFCLAPVAVRHVTPDNPWLPLLSAQQVVEIAGAFHKFGARRVPVARLRIGLLLRAHVLAPTLRHHRALLRTPSRTPSHACMHAARSCLELLAVCVSHLTRPAVADLDGNGHIDVDEIFTVFTNLGYPKSMDEVTRLANELDSDKNGTIEFDEFIGMIAGKMLRADGVAELRTAFSVLFDDGSGYVSVERLKQLFRSSGSMSLGDEEIAQLLGMLTIDEQGRVPYSQLRELECWDLLLPDGEVVSLRNAPPSMPPTPSRPAPAASGGLPPIGPSTPDAPSPGGVLGSQPPLPPLAPAPASARLPPLAHGDTLPPIR